VQTLSISILEREQTGSNKCQKTVVVGKAADASQTQENTTIKILHKNEK
jgi:hypothetical protein